MRQRKTTKTTIYRRHAATCPIADQPLNLANCECPLWIHGKVAGKFIRKSLDTRDLSTAERRRADFETGRNATPQTPAAISNAPDGSVSLEYAALDFKDSKARKASNTHRLYCRAVDHFVAWAERHNCTLLAHIDAPQIRQYFKECGANWTANTSQSRLTHLRVWFSYCQKARRWIQYSPAAHADLNFAAGKGATSNERMPFSAEEVSTIARAVERMPEADRDRARALVYLLLYSGMRISDATFFERACLTPTNAARYFVIKTRKEITAAPELQKPALDALAKLPASRVYFFQPDAPDNYAAARSALRSGKKGGEFSLLMPQYEERVRAATALVVRVLRLAGVSGACHRFRDTFAVSMLQGSADVPGVDIYTVSKMLGHSDVRITDAHYVKFLPGHAEKLSRTTRCLTYDLPDMIAL